MLLQSKILLYLQEGSEPQPRIEGIRWGMMETGGAGSQQGEKKDIDNENESQNSLRMKNKMTMKEKRFSFFTLPQEIKSGSLLTFSLLPLALQNSQHCEKVKEPFLASTPLNVNAK